MRSLIEFNILSPEKREQVLRGIDYIYISKGKYTWYFREYLPKPEWRTDIFRKNIEDQVQNNKDFTLYGKVFRIVQNNDRGILIGVSSSEGFNN
jgi:hypothetical protein